MGGFKILRLVQNPLGQPAPPGQRGDIVRVSNEWSTIYLDPGEFERMSEAAIRRMLSEADPRPIAMLGTSTMAGGRGLPIHDAASRRSSAAWKPEQDGRATLDVS